MSGAASIAARARLFLVTGGSSMTNGLENLEIKRSADLARSSL